VIKFAADTCRGCPGRDQCTHSTSPNYGRQLTVAPREVHDAQHAARATQDTPDWQARYAVRAGVEGTIRQGVAVTGMRRARYRGLPKTRLEHVYSAVALNLIRLDAYWNGPRPGPNQDQPPRPPRPRPRSLIELASRVFPRHKQAQGATSLLVSVQLGAGRHGRDGHRHSPYDRARVKPLAPAVGEPYPAKGDSTAQPAAGWVWKARQHTDFVRWCDHGQRSSSARCVALTVLVG
jgi:hypothetical protein